MMQEVQQETEKVKALYQSSAKVLEKWARSDIISFCDDKDFLDLLQNLSELDLEAAVYGLQRQLEIEVQLEKCLDHLREINSDCIATTSKLITSQGTVAKLRSRLLRCINKQLNKHGNEDTLPPWYSDNKNNKERSLEIMEGNQTIGSQENRCVQDAGSISKPDIGSQENCVQDAGSISKPDIGSQENRVQDAGSISKPDIGSQENRVQDAGSISKPDIGSQENRVQDAGSISKPDIGSPSLTSRHVEPPNMFDTCNYNQLKGKESDFSQSLCDPSQLNWVEPKEISIPPVNEGEGNHANIEQESKNGVPITYYGEEKEDSSAPVKIHKVSESIEGIDGIKILQETLHKNLHEKRRVSKGVSMATPPKPAPYSALETMPMLYKAPAANNATDEDESDGVVIKEQILMQDWDPSLLLQDLFGECGKEDMQTPKEDTAALSIVRMSGYMEKLPSSYKQKKSSVFKGWKKRHFKAFDGKLFYFEDHRNNEPLGMVDLKGSLVVISAGKILELIDSEGKAILKLRCTTPVEAEDWQHAIETEAKRYQELMYEEISVNKEASVIIIDLGSNSVKAGFAKEEAWPQLTFPCVCAALKEDESDCIYGFAGLEPKRRKKSNLRFPLRRSLKIDKLKFSPSHLTGILEHVFLSIKADPSKHKVVMTLPQNTSLDDKGALVEILLGYFNVQGCYLQEQAILAMYSYSAVSGVIVDIGDHIDVIPVVEGCVIEAGASRLPYGGRQVTDMLARLLTEKGHRFFSEVESYIVRYIKEQCCYVSEKEICKEQEMPSYSSDVILEKYKIPDGTRKVTVDTARYRCTEGLFEPIVWGKDHPGISDLVHKAILACGMDVRKQMSRSIYLSGGGSMLPGFPERLHTEVCSLLPPHTIVQVHAGTDRHHAAFIGASVVARLPLFEELCITQEEWNDSGIDALEKWHNL